MTFVTAIITLQYLYDYLVQNMCPMNNFELAELRINEWFIIQCLVSEISCPGMLTDVMIGSLELYSEDGKVLY